MMVYFLLSTDVITFEEYTGQAEGALTNNHSPSLNSVKHPSGIYLHTDKVYSKYQYCLERMEMTSLLTLNN